jgi:hypothetical protein
MSVMPRPTQSGFFEDSLLLKPSVEAPATRPANLKNDRFQNGRPPPGRLALLGTLALLSRLDPLAFARYLIAFFIGVTATLAWQSHRGTAREMIAPASSPSEQQRDAISFDLDPVRQSIDRISASVAISQEQMRRSIDRLADGQEQMTRGITELQTVEQYVLDRISTLPPRPAPATVSKPVLQPRQAPIQLTPARNP